MTLKKPGDFAELSRKEAHTRSLNFRVCVRVYGLVGGQKTEASPVNTSFSLRGAAGRVSPSVIPEVDLYT